MDTLIRRIDMAIADIHTQLDRVQKASGGYQAQRSTQQGARDSARANLERQRQALRDARERADRLRVDVQSAPSAKEGYEMQRETAELERACSMCWQETEEAEREGEDLARRTEEAKTRLRHTVAFCEAQRERLVAMRDRVGAMEARSAEWRALAAARVAAEQKEAQRREEALVAVHESVVLQRRLRLENQKRESEATAAEASELAIAASKLRGLALERELAGIRTRLADFRMRWGEGEVAIATLRQKKAQYDKTITRLRMENADMEAQRDRARREEETFQAVEREAKGVDAQRRDHEDAVFAQFVLECDARSPGTAVTRDVARALVSVQCDAKRTMRW